MAKKKGSTSVMDAPVEMDDAAKEARAHTAVGLPQPGVVQYTPQDIKALRDVYAAQQGESEDLIDFIETLDVQRLFASLMVVIGTLEQTDGFKHFKDCGCEGCGRSAVWVEYAKNIHNARVFRSIFGE